MISSFYSFAVLGLALGLHVKIQKHLRTDKIHKSVTCECFHHPVENLSKGKNTNVQKDACKYSNVYFAINVSQRQKYNKILKKCACLTEPGSHVGQDFDDGPLQAAFILPLISIVTLHYDHHLYGMRSYKIMTSKNMINMT